MANYDQNRRKRVRLDIEPAKRDFCTYRRLAPVSNVIFSKTDNLSTIAIYKLYLEVRGLGLDITEVNYQGG